MTPLTWNSDRQQFHSSAMTRVWGKWHNFLAADGQWARIDLAPRQAGGLFTVAGAPYSAEIPTLANDWATLQSTNRYDIWTKRAMPDAPVGIQKRYPTAAPVAGIPTATGILFPLAFTALGADRLVQFHEQEIRDLVVFPAEPPGTGDVEIPFEIDFGQLPILESTGRGKPAREADFRAEKIVTHGLSFTTGRFRGLKIKQPRVWDAAGLSRNITLVGKVMGTRFVGKKVIPRAFFASAKFPVTTDTVDTFYPDPDVESTSVDGNISASDSQVSWATLHDAASGTADDTNALLQTIMISSFDDTWDILGRSFILFDTSSLPDSDTVSAATLNQYATFVVDQSSQSISVVGSTPASNTALVGEDYDQVGTTRFAADVTLASITTSAYNVWTLNAQGLIQIVPTGITKLATCLSADVDNSPPSVATEDQLQASSADQAGTTQDPYLEVTHDVAATSAPILSLGVEPAILIWGR